MNIYIENEYDREIDVDYTDIINKVVCQAVDFIKCPYECEVNLTFTDNDFSLSFINWRVGFLK